MKRFSISMLFTKRLKISGRRGMPSLHQWVPQGFLSVFKTLLLLPRRFGLTGAGEVSHEPRGRDNHDAPHGRVRSMRKTVYFKVYMDGAWLTFWANVPSHITSGLVVWSLLWDLLRRVLFSSDVNFEIVDGFCLGGDLSSKTFVHVRLSVFNRFDRLWLGILNFVVGQARVCDFGGVPLGDEFSTEQETRVEMLHRVGTGSLNAFVILELKTLTLRRSLNSVGSTESMHSLFSAISALIEPGAASLLLELNEVVDNLLHDGVSARYDLPALSAKCGHVLPCLNIVLLKESMSLYEIFRLFQLCSTLVQVLLFLNGQFSAACDEAHSLSLECLSVVLVLISFYGLSSSSSSKISAGVGRSRNWASIGRSLVDGCRDIRSSLDCSLLGRALGGWTSSIGHTYSEVDLALAPGGVSNSPDFLLDLAGGPVGVVTSERPAENLSMDLDVEMLGKKWARSGREAGNPSTRSARKKGKWKVGEMIVIEHSLTIHAQTTSILPSFYCLIRIERKRTSHLQMTRWYAVRLYSLLYRSP
ncbi:hypothetical protein KCU62_g273, partial [Aureobasidium sp. EXF-3399]